MEISAMKFAVDALHRNRDHLPVNDLSRTIGRAFGIKLSAAREKAQLTQEELGHLSTVNRSEISQLELGRHTPRLDTVVKLAGALNVEPCELIGNLRFRPPQVAEKGSLFEV
jgi:transcriptional regulator with XRE-family HTH domain